MYMCAKGPPSSSHSGLTVRTKRAKTHARSLASIRTKGSQVHRYFFSLVDFESGVRSRAFAYVDKQLCVRDEDGWIGPSIFEGGICVCACMRKLKC